MKQIIHDMKNGNIILEEVPVPQLKQGNIIAKTTCSLISPGTEKMLVEFGKANFIKKASQQPDKVKQLVDKIKTDGLLSTIDTVRTKLDQPVHLGYCNAGVVSESNVEGIKIGERIISNGPHAEVVRIAKNLCTKVPDNVDDETASFTVLCSIALQGIRLLKPTIGETIVVQGLGLVGLLCVQILKANGCGVIGIDFNSSRCELAKEFGADTIDLSKGEDAVLFSQNLTRKNGVDGVLICTASEKDDIVHQSAKMCRKQGRIVLVGTASLNLRREDFYKKEISLQVSASYGPGRYDPMYEEKGQDYPIGYVRWTEKRNFEAVLQLMSEGKINVKPMITHHFPFSHAIKAYDLLASDKPSLGIILEYKNRKEVDEKKTVQLLSKTRKIKKIPSLGFIGAGNYAGAVLIPAFNKLDVYFKTIASSGGLSGVLNGKKFGFQETTTDLDSIFQDNKIDVVVIATRHNTHADLVIKSLQSGKHVFVEKPLALTLDELESIQSCIIQNPKSMLMVGFNRRFSPFVVKIKELLSFINNPFSMVMTVNAGAIPFDHWTQDPDVGGGRIVGEACHFIDLFCHLAESQITDFERISMDSKTNDTVTLNLKFHNGSIGTIHYFSNGSRSLPKERLEVFYNGKVLQLDNYKTLKGYGITGFSKMKKLKQDKGQQKCAKVFINAIKQGSKSPIPIEEIIEVSRISIELAGKI